MKITAAEQRTWTKGAREWWSSVEGEFDLTASEIVTAREIGRGLSRLDRLWEHLAAADTLTTENRFGETVVDPLAVEARLLAQTVARLIGSLRLPEVESDWDTDESSQVRERTPQRRTQARGFYAVPNR
ncbi:MAG: hypothetical protein INR66_12725 [Gordonia polyisoprenivorans]|nr:hypothetical protein [Gordonia polyisoprenivorans]